MLNSQEPTTGYRQPFNFCNSVVRTDTSRVSGHVTTDTTYSLTQNRVRVFK